MKSINKATKYSAYIILFIFLAAGIYFRFTGINWNQGTNLHPDEYGLTNTLTQLSFPQTVSQYFNTRISSISPYQKYDIFGNATVNGPDNRLRWGQWPIIIIRGLAEILNQTGYDEIRILGRYLVALLDTISVLLILIIGWELYGFTIGYLAATLSSLAVMQIQQSHFMTVDNFGVFFSTFTMFAAVQISRHPPLQKIEYTHQKSYVLSLKPLIWYALFGIGFGMAVASKINLILLGGMVLIAAFISIAEMKIFHKKDIRKIFLSILLFVSISFLVSFITFRICQPMSFRSPTGDTTFTSMHLNQDWIESMKVAQQESSGIGGGPPAEQWTDRPILIFPLINMVFWGMGIPLGLASWVGFITAGWRAFKNGKEWKSHLLPFIWVGGYFFFMATRWVKSIRYFLPIYPFLCLFAAWGLVVLFRQVRPNMLSNTKFFFLRCYKFLVVFLPGVIVIGGTFIWALVFTASVYQQDHTRIQATQWILQNIPAPIHIQTNQNGVMSYIPISVPEGQQITKDMPYIQPFSSIISGKLSSVVVPHIKNTGTDPIPLHLLITTDVTGNDILDQATLMIFPSQDERGIEVQGQFHGVEIKEGSLYYLRAYITSPDNLLLYRNVIADEDWDESLPFPYDGYDPFGQFYQGVIMNVRWADDETKKEMYLKNLRSADYIILPSQRAVWSACRLPLMYPMTLEYYRSLFSGELGFNRIAFFNTTFKIGPLWFSDISGTFAWNSSPDIPLFNFNTLAAEEAFSVYDHPPVWIFKKGGNFSMPLVFKILDSINLQQVIIQSPKNTKVFPIK